MRLRLPLEHLRRMRWEVKDLESALFSVCSAEGNSGVAAKSAHVDPDRDDASVSGSLSVTRSAKASAGIRYSELSYDSEL